MAELVDDRAENPGRWIESQCRALNVSVSQVAAAAGIDRTTIFRWKTGRTSPYWDSLRRVQVVIRGFWAEHDRRGD